MTRKIMLAGVTLLTACATFGFGPSHADGPDPVLAPPPRPSDPVKFIWWCTGPVVAVTKDSITVRGVDAIEYSGKRLETRPGEHRGDHVTVGTPVKLILKDNTAFAGARLVRNRDGATLFDEAGRVVRAEPAVPLQRTFPFRGDLARQGGGLGRYSLADVRVGDVVELEYVGVGDEECAVDVTIRRRPGGRVPRIPNELPIPEHLLPPTVIRFHERMNAEQDWEERGIPLPEKYLHDGRNDDLNPPYPPTAPAPRPAARK